MCFHKSHKSILIIYNSLFTVACRFAKSVNAIAMNVIVFAIDVSRFAMSVSHSAMNVNRSAIDVSGFAKRVSRSAINVNADAMSADLLQLM